MQPIDIRMREKKDFLLTGHGSIVGLNFYVHIFKIFVASYKISTYMSHLNTLVVILSHFSLNILKRAMKLFHLSILTFYAY